MLCYYCFIIVITRVWYRSKVMKFISESDRIMRNQSERTELWEITLDFCVQYIGQRKILTRTSIHPPPPTTTQKIWFLNTRMLVATAIVKSDLYPLCRFSLSLPSQTATNKTAGKIIFLVLARFVLLLNAPVRVFSFLLHICSSFYLSCVYVLSLDVPSTFFFFCQVCLFLLLLIFYICLPT